MEDRYEVDLKFCWMDGVKMALGNRGMTVEAGRQGRNIGKSGELWYICK